MRVKVFVAAGLLAGCISCAGMAQMQASAGPSAGPSAPMGAPMDPAKAQDALLSLFEGELKGVVNAMPADKFNFAPMSGAMAGSKFDGVRTFGQQVIHLTQANYYFFTSFGGPKPGIDVRALSNLKTKDEIVAALNASFVYAHQAIATITPTNAYETIKGADGLDTRATVAGFAVAHGYDHYGQLVEYLRMNGIVPPGSK